MNSGSTFDGLLPALVRQPTLWRLDNEIRALEPSQRLLQIEMIKKAASVCAAEERQNHANFLSYIANRISRGGSDPVSRRELLEKLLAEPSLFERFLILRRNPELVGRDFFEWLFSRFDPTQIDQFYDRAQVLLLAALIEKNVPMTAAFRVIWASICQRRGNVVAYEWHAARALQEDPNAAHLVLDPSLPKHGTPEPTREEIERIATPEEMPGAIARIRELREGGSREFLFALVGRFAGNLVDVGRLDDASMVLEEVLPGDLVDYAEAARLDLSGCLMLRGILHEQQRRYAAALTDFRSSVDVAGSADWSVTGFVAQEHMAAILTKLKMPFHAVTSASVLVHLSESHVETADRQAVAHNRLGAALASASRFADAMVSYEDAMACWNRAEGLDLEAYLDTIFGIAEASSELSDEDYAEDLARRAIGTARKTRVFVKAVCRYFEVVVPRLVSSLVMTLTRDLLKGATNHRDFPVLASVTNSLGDHLTLIGRPLEAIGHYRRLASLQLPEALQEARFQAACSWCRNSLEHRPADLEAAFETLLAAVEGQLRHAAPAEPESRRSAVERSRAGVDCLLDVLLLARTHLGAARANLWQELAFDLVETIKILDSGAEFAGFGDPGSPRVSGAVTLGSIFGDCQVVAAGGATAVSLIVGEKWTKAIVVDFRNKTVDFRICEIGSAQIVAAAAEVRRITNGDAMAFPPIPPMDGDSPEVRRFVLFNDLDAKLQPVIDLMKNELTIVLSDGALDELPLTMLQGATGQPLIERTALIFQSSFTAISTVVKSIPPNRADDLNVVEVGVAAREDVDPNLFESGREIFAGNLPIRLTSLIGPAASAQAVLKAAAGADVLHFACHAFFSPLNPMESALLLAADGERPSLVDFNSSWFERMKSALTVVELSKLELVARLVVLRGCSTGVASGHVNDRGIDLGKALLSAGADTVVSTKWNVDQRSSQVILNGFYQRYLSQSMPAWKALRESQLESLSSDRVAFRHWYHWAPFVVSGDWR